MAFRIKTTERRHETATDRQERISWWSQEKLRQARVMIIGAGALGNEVAKNLALVGVGYMLIVDFDDIEVSNLSRTALFRQDDLGKRKARVAAQRARELNVEPAAVVEAFDGDVVWDLGLGVYRRLDIVLGCLDNIEARLAVNRACLLTGKPYLDAGIRELAGSIYLFQPPFSSCFSCATTKREREGANARYDSCFQTLRRGYAQGKLATVQVTSAIIAAMQVEHALKWLHGRLHLNGVRIQYDGSSATPYFDATTILPRPHCECQALQPLPAFLRLAGGTRTTTLRGLLRALHEAGIEEPVVKFPNSFVPGVECSHCGEYTEIMRPLHRLKSDELQCRHCRRAGDREGLQLHYLSDSLDLAEAGINETREQLLDLTLNKLGFPLMHIYGAQDRQGQTHYVELANDFTETLPGLAQQNCNFSEMLRS